jgi:hypothetical protein
MIPWGAAPAGMILRELQQKRELILSEAEFSQPEHRGRGTCGYKSPPNGGFMEG